MAGSYRHCIVSTEDQRFAGVRLLDHLGDAYEALEEMYGMVWLLADGDAERVLDAAHRYKEGLERSPGVLDPSGPSPWPYDDE